MFSEEHKQIASILPRNECVQVGICAGVEWIEEDEEDLGMCDADERVASDGRETEEGDRRPTRQIGEDE